MGSTTGVRVHTTQVHPAHDRPHSDISRPWQLLIAGLLLVGLAAVSVRPVCLPDMPGANERALGVRHERRGTTWYHCEPWISRVLGG